MYSGTGTGMMMGGGGGQDYVEKMDLDELYEKKRMIEEQKKALYNRVLRLAHKTIKHNAQQNKTYCWYEIPEVLWGYPKYDVSECIGHLLYELKENNFIIRYVHPNKLFIVWEHWIPAFTRMNLKLKSKGQININQYGQLIPNDDDDDLDVDDETPKKKGKASSSKKVRDDDEDDDDVEVEDEWEKSEDDDFDPDFEEFDVPKSKGKKSTKKGKEDEDFEVEDDFKSLDLFDEGDDLFEDDDF